MSETKKDVVDKNFEKDRKEFCLDQKRGSEYIEYTSLMKRWGEHMKDIDEREKKKDLYSRVAKLKKVGIGEIQKLLEPKMKKAHYVNLRFEEPVISRSVVVGFNTIDMLPRKDADESCVELKSLIVETLKGYNWKLVNNSVNYRLGFLSGKIKGMESDEELVKEI